MDLAGLERLLERIEAGDIRIVARDLTEPSPLALEVLSARPYAYLDDAPLEERRTQAVMSRRWLSPEAASDLGRLDPEAIARVRGEAWPEATNADELHDALVWLGFLGMDEARAGPGWSDWLSDLARAKRATRLHLPDATLWIAAERLPQFRALWPVAKLEPAIAPPPGAAGADCSREEALVESRRGSPVTNRDGSTTAAWRGRWRGCGCDRARRERVTAGKAGRAPCARPRSRWWRVGMSRIGPRWPRKRITSNPASARRRSSITFASTGPHSSRSLWKAPACCAPRSRRRWPNWLRSAW